MCLFCGHHQQQNIEVDSAVFGLGNSTKFASAVDRYDAADNAQTIATTAKTTMSPMLAAKWQRKKAVNDLISGNRDLRRKFGRVAGCCKTIVKGETVQVVRSVASGHASYKHLLTCGNVWACPLCAAKIQARRGDEIARAVDWAYAHGYKVAMITRTQPHHVGQPLAEVIAAHTAATRKFKAGRWYQDFKRTVGIVGSIRASEVTYGSHGWHWHSHEIIIYTDEQVLQDYFMALRGRWVACCEAAGVAIPDKAAMMSYGLDVMVGCHAADYLAKMGRSWGIDKEISRASAKRGAGCTPFELCSAKLFAEYLLATAGRAQLVWSRGLKAKVGVAEVSDSEAAEAAEDKTEAIAEISRRGWRTVCEEQAQAEVLTVATRGGFAALRAWFAARGLVDEVVPPTLFDDFGTPIFSDWIS